MENLEALNFLTGSKARWQILERLYAEPMDFGALRSELDLPQSTLNRNLTKLEEEGWVREDADRTYRLTVLGDYFVDQIRPLEDVMTVVDALSEYPDAFPLDEFDFDLTALADANYRTASGNQPYAVINRVRSLIDGSETIHSFRPTYNPAYIDVISRIAAQPDAEVIGIVPDHQLDAAQADEDFEDGQFDDVETVEFRTWDGDTDYALVIVDDESVILTGHHEGGMPSVMIESTHPEVLAWARSTFGDIYDRSVPTVEARES